MLAHCLTGLRLLLALPVALTLAGNALLSPPLLLLCLLAAIASDVLDGKVARRQGTASAAGQLFDHTTDCIFVSSGLAGAAYAGLVPIWLPPLVAIAFIQYVLDSRWRQRRKALRMSVIGRWNGVLYFVPLVLLALAWQAWLQPVAAPLYLLAHGLVWVLVASTLLSIVDRALAR